MTSTEKLPDIYSTKSTSYQSIQERNDIIDEYIKILESRNKRETKQNENISISEDDKDPFSSNNIKNLKPIKSSKNKLILSNFKKRESTKSHSSFCRNKNKNLKEEKNCSESNIIQRIHKASKINDINNNRNSKWVTCSSSYTNYINFYNKKRKNNANVNLFKYRNEHNNLLNQRNYTAYISQKNENKKLYNQRINSSLNTQKILENKRQIYEKLIKEKNNPYGLNWINKVFKKNNNEKIELSKRQFHNGVPVLKLLGKKGINKRDIKKRLIEIQKKKKEEENEYNKIIHAKAKLNKDDLDDEYNIPNEILEQFNQNKKIFLN